MCHPDHIMSSDSWLQTEQFVAVNPEVCESYCGQAFLRWVEDSEFDKRRSGDLYEGMMSGGGLGGGGADSSSWWCGSRCCLTSLTGTCSWHSVGALPSTHTHTHTLTAFHSIFCSILHLFVTIWLYKCNNLSSGPNCLATCGQIL